MAMNLSWGEVAEFRRKPRPRPASRLSPVGLDFAIAFNAAGWALIFLAFKGCS